MKKLDKKSLQIGTLLFMLCFIVLSGCGNPDTSKKENVKENQVQTEPANTEFPVTFTDDSGKEVTIKEKPDKIVSVLPSTTEILFALGLGDRIVGVSDYDTYPEEVKEIQTVGDLDLNTEIILSLLPDIIFLQQTHSENNSDVIAQLEDAGITPIVIGSDSSTFEEVYTGIELIGEATGTSKEADSIISEMEGKIESLKEKAELVTKKKSVLVEIQPEPTIYAAGANTFIDEMLNIIGAENAAGDMEGWPEYTEEEVVKLNPDVIVTTYGDYIEKAVDLVLSRDGWQEVKAVKSKQVFEVNSDTVTRPGPRLTDGVEELAKAIYPEIFE